MKAAVGDEDVHASAHLPLPNQGFAPLVPPCARVKTSYSLDPRSRRLTHVIALKVAAFGALVAIALSGGPTANADLPRGGSTDCYGKDVTIFWGPAAVATDGDDVIMGTEQDDEIRSLGGDDVICGGGGTDRIYSGAGGDIANGDSGRDFVNGGTGADSVFGGPGRDDVAGGPGTDRVGGNYGNDRLRGGGSNDFLIGGPKHDYCHGGDGSDRVRTCEELWAVPRSSAG
jgi:Ca2+-binding RTX toxin-like protein